MKKLRTCLLIAAAVLLAGCATPTAEPTEAPPTPTPYGEMLPRVEAVASSESAFVASYAIDGSGNSRWGSGDGTPQWIYVDLGDSYTITRVIVDWFVVLEMIQRVAYATVYEVQVSDDAENWTTVARIEDGDGLTDDFTGLSTSGRYVRVYCIEHIGQGGQSFSILELEVYGEGAAAD